MRDITEVPARDWHDETGRQIWFFIEPEPGKIVVFPDLSKERRRNRWKRCKPAVFPIFQCGCKPDIKRVPRGYAVSVEIRINGHTWTFMLTDDPEGTIRIGKAIRFFVVTRAIKLLWGEDYAGTDSNEPLPLHWCLIGRGTAGLILRSAPAQVVIGISTLYGTYQTSRYVAHLVYLIQETKREISADTTEEAQKSPRRISRLLLKLTVALTVPAAYLFTPTIVYVPALTAYGAYQQGHFTGQLVALYRRGKGKLKKKNTKG